MTANKRNPSSIPQATAEHLRSNIMSQPGMALSVKVILHDFNFGNGTPFSSAPRVFLYSGGIMGETLSARSHRNALGCSD